MGKRTVARLIAAIAVTTVLVLAANFGMDKYLKPAAPAIEHSIRCALEHAFNDVSPECGAEVNVPKD